MTKTLLVLCGIAISLAFRGFRAYMNREEIDDFPIRIPRKPDTQHAANVTAHTGSGYRMHYLKW